MILGTTWAQDGNTLPTAYTLGVLDSALVRNGTVNTASTVDYYQFVVAGSVRHVTASIPGGSLGPVSSPGPVPGVTLALLRDANGDGLGEVLTQAGNAFLNDFAVSLWLDPGTYYARVERNGSMDTTYQLNLSQTPHPESFGIADNSPTNARPISAGQTIGDYVGVVDTVDHYRLEVVGVVKEVTVSLSGRSTFTGTLGRPSLDFSVAQDLNHDGVLEILGSNSSIFGNESFLSFWLDPGVYYVRVNSSPSPGNENAYYSLSVSESPRPTSPGNGDNTTDTARFWVPGQPVPDFVGNNDILDYYRFDVEGQATTVMATIPGSSLTGIRRGFTPPSVDLALMRGSQELASGTSILYNDISLSAVLVPGTYFARVRRNSSGENNTPYLLALSGVAAPKLTIISMTGVLDFGGILVGGSTNRALTIHNNGTVGLNVTGISYPNGFSGAFSGEIPAGGQQNVTVIFAPNAAGVFGGRLEVAADVTMGTRTFPISGTGIPVPTRILEFTPLLAFGEVEMGRTEMRSLTLRNSGNRPLTISGLTITANFSGNYSGIIPPGGSTQVPIAFSPSATGIYSGTIAVESDATSLTNEIQLTGLGGRVRSRIIGVMGDLAFGPVEAFQSATRSMIITNSGEAAFTVTGISFPPGFTGAFSGVVQANGSRSVPVTFRPGQVRDYSGVVLVNADYSSGDNSAQVTGSGTRVLTRIIAVSDLSFGEVPIRSRLTKSLVISNWGEAAFTVTNLILPRGFDGSFNGQIPAGGFRSVSLTFHPDAVEDYSGTVKVISDSNAGTASAMVAGIGVPAALAPVAGVYCGLFYEGDAIRHETSGSFKITVSSRGSYSAALALGGKALSKISGAFSFDGMATNHIQRRGLPELVLIWTTDPELGGSITGTLTSPTWQGFLIGDRAAFQARTNAAPYSGTYTVSFNGIPGAVASPDGYSFATVIVDGDGTARFAGSLADGNKFACAVPLSRNGACPFYLSALYGGRGSVLGWLLFGGQEDRDLGGLLSWIRPQATSPNASQYHDGFSFYSECVGFYYNPPSARAVGIAGMTNGTLTVSGGTLFDALQGQFLIDAKNKLTTVGSEKIALKFASKSGRFTGTLQPSGSKTKLPFQGIILQPTNSATYGVGYFLQSVTGGRVVLEAAP